MPLFSIIGLMLSVFGATYTAIAAFRNHYNPIVGEAVKQSEEKVRSVRDLRGEPDAQVAQKYADRMRRAQRWWHWCGVTPIGLFLIFAFGVAGWLFFHWDRVSTNFDSELCKYLVEVNAILNFCALCGAVLSYACLRSANHRLNEHYQLAAKSSARPASSAQSPTLSFQTPPQPA